MAVKKSAPAAQTAPKTVEIVHIHWPLWLKLSAFLVAACSGLMIISFFFTIFMHLSRSPNGF